MKSSETKRVAIYVRVSTDDQSTEMQLRELHTYLNARGWALTMAYEDMASGTSTAKRIQLKELMRDARARKFDCVVVWKLDRFARSLKDLVVMLTELQEVGVEFISLKDSIDLTTAQGRLMMQLLGAFGEFEASLIRERVRSGIRNARAKGQRWGRLPELDYARIGELRKEGLTFSQIATVVGCSKAGVAKALKSKRPA